MKCLVTGATGSVGSRIVKRLLEDHHEVLALARETSDLSLLDTNQVEIVRGDMTDAESLRQAAEGVDWVFHSAAPVDDWVPEEVFWKVNVEGTRSLLNACRKQSLSRFVFMSSINVYGIHPAPNTNENAPYVGEHHPYCETKIQAEKMLLAAHLEEGFPVTILRPANIWGPTANAWTIRPVQKLLADEVRLIGGGRGAINPIYVDNLADVAVRFADLEETNGEGYIVTDGIRDWCVRDFFHKYCGMLGIPPVTRSIPKPVAMGVAWGAETLARLNGKRPFITRFVVQMLTKNCHYDVRKLQSIYGTEPHYSFEEGLEETKRWLVNRGIV